MKITDVKTFVVGNPPPHFGGRYWIFLKLTTDGGVEGYGEVYSVPFHPHVVERMIQDVCERQVIGADPFKIERLWRIIYSSGFTQRPDTSILGILSGIEMACWDIVGKELNRPVYELLGGQVRDRLRSYTYLYPEEGDKTDVYSDPDLAAERACAYVKQGFTAVKFDPVTPYSSFDPRQLSLEALDLAERFVKTIREAVGSRCDLLFGTHGQMTPAGALRLARRLEAAIRSGLRSRCRRRCRRRWPRSPTAPAFPSPPANGSPPSMNFPGFYATRLPPSCSRRWGVSAAFWRPRRSRGWPRATMYRWRPISIAGQSKARPTCNWARVFPTF